MTKIIPIVIAVMAIGVSCTTTAARDLNLATRASSDASFTFETGTQEFASAVSNFSHTVTVLEFALQNFADADNNYDAVRSRDEALILISLAVLTRDIASRTHDNARQAFENSIRSGVDFSRAEHDLLLSPDPWGNNTTVRSRAISAHNISVRIHNNALREYESTARFFLSTMQSFTAALDSYHNSVQAHNLED